ncbi:phage tail sheath subtilisin-like domain-containing protein [Sphingomonas faeni]|uniref:phage tail sheath subtilisin-like domain-containing protein n=1 Tax=Sphingomonas faeni TaxID=185950 RepID=UPI0020C7BE48|nr:phage tail sheath subtilisin-like domain-containing protein [Sphingomonas faeni]MCP8892993.1 phage tail sheath subtilisin-like domain-containing protein [Sphingomonas faeni]
MSSLHGINVTEVKKTTRSIATVATAVIGLVATAPDAVAGAFPLDTAVKVTNLDDAIEEAGATGTLRAALIAIAGQVTAPIVVVRVSPGATPADTATAVIGTDVAGVKTGMQTLLTASTQLNLHPRIIGAPGLESELVTKALVVVAKRLRARVYAMAVGDDRGEAIAHRALFPDARELTLLWPGVTAPYGADGASIGVPVAAVAMGARAAIDQTQGWHKTLSNVALPDIDGLAADVTFDIQDADCDANVLNASDLVTVVRIAGELRFWGNRTCAIADGDFVFESACRTAQILADTVALGLVWAMDKPLLPSLAKDIVEQINEKFRQEKRGGRILGAVALFDGARNPVDQLKAGKLLIGYRYTFVPPLEALGLEQEISDEFFADFASLVAGN